MTFHCLLYAYLLYYYYYYNSLAHVIRTACSDDFGCLRTQLTGSKASPPIGSVRNSACSTATMQSNNANAVEYAPKDVRV